MTFSTPILFLIFNRPSTTKKVFESIRNVKPDQLFIACDGPRPNKPDDQFLVAQSRSIVHQINWECSVHTLYRDTNLGCKLAIEEALNWFFSSIERGIILEDDVLPSVDFFYAMETFLYLYKDDFEISSICGRNEISLFRGVSNTPILTDKFWCWGWASWSNRFANFNSDSPYQSNFQPDYHPTSVFDKAYTNSMISSMQLGNVNTWDYPLDFFFRSRGMKSLLLPFNTIINLGFGSGTHATGARLDTAVHQPPSSINYSINIPYYDKWHTKKVFLSRNSGSYLMLYYFIVVNFYLPLSLAFSRLKSLIRRVF